MSQNAAIDPVIFQLPPLPAADEFTDEADAQAVAFQGAAHALAVFADALVQARQIQHVYRGKQEVHDAEALSEQVAAANNIGLGVTGAIGGQ